MANNFVNDAVDKIIDNHPEKSKQIVKWVIGIAIFLVTIAFGYGQYRMNSLNKLVNMEKSIEIIKEETNNNTQAVINLKKDVENTINSFKNEGYNWFTDYQQYSKNQFDLLIDYGSTNKELLKRMIDINSQEKSQQVKEKIIQSNIPKHIFDPNAFVMSYAISLDKKDTLFLVKNATKEFINKIPKTYKINSSVPNKFSKNLFDIAYQNYK